MKLKKTVSFEELMGDAPPVVPGEPGTKVKSGNIMVAGKHFVDWYNKDFQPLHKGKHPTLVYGKDGAHPIEFPAGQINKANFQKVFDHCEQLWAKELGAGEFVAILCIMLNEVGGRFRRSPRSTPGTAFPRAAARGRSGLGSPLRRRAAASGLEATAAPAGQ